MRLPQILDYWASKETRVCARRLAQDPGLRSVDASEVKWIEPSGAAAVVAACIDRSRRGHPLLSVTPPFLPEPKRYWEEVGVGEVASSPNSAHYDGSGSSLRVHQLRDHPRGLVERIAELTEHHLSLVGTDAKFEVSLCLNELIQNTLEHANSPIGAIVHTRTYRVFGNVRIVVLDYGIGIPAALRRAGTINLKSATDAEAIVLAVTKEGLTSRSGQRAGGKGLKHLVALATSARGGSMRVASLTAAATFRPGTKPSTARRLDTFLGTLVEVDFRPGLEPTDSVEEIF